MPQISEKAFEEVIEAALLAFGPDALPTSLGAVHSSAHPFGEMQPGAYLRREPDHYDRALCLDPEMAVSFVQATQPEEWEKLAKQHGAEVRQKFLHRLASEVAKRGVLDVLRKGIKDSGCKFRLAYFRPNTGLNAELEQLYGGNLFSVVRQLRYSEKNQNSIDMVLFLNGLPLFTAELKNPFNGQTVQHAITQYRKDRNPKGEPLLQFGRCVAHFAVDPELVYVATHLQGEQTRFLPFNRGNAGGAGNPPSKTGFATAYLWERIWSRDSVLDLVQHFVQEVEEEDDKGKKTGKRSLIFPRYHQLDAVRRLVSDARSRGPGQRYLIQHSAGSGKSNSIAWLAHQLSILHDADDHRVFDSVIVITDRRVLDRQLQKNVRAFEQTTGVVENIDKKSTQLKAALEAGKNIIVTTLQKFPVIAGEIAALPGKRFAVIVDEAHSSQSGESTKSLKSVLSAGSLEQAEGEEGGEEEDLEDRIVEEIRKRGPQKNVSTFAFTATPKPKTLNLFGVLQADGTYAPFSLYSMRQAIEEGFILDVLSNYTTYKTFWNLLKKVEDDPEYDRSTAAYLLRQFVDLHEHTIDKKVALMVEHFAQHGLHSIGGKGKAMIVTRSRLHAVRYRRAVDRYLKEHGHPFRALVAFSGTVDDGGIKETEAGMNGFPDTQTAESFKRDEYRFLIVANKFQTGFDQPLLHTMYVDKKLSGVHAVQTLSRLNRTHPGKTETLVLDFANEVEEIQEAFAPYYDRTILSGGTDPNQLHDLEHRLLAFGIFAQTDVDGFATIYFTPKATQDKLYHALKPVEARYRDVEEAEQAEFHGVLGDYVRLYAFLSQLLTFTDAELEKLYVFARLLLRVLPKDGKPLPLEVQGTIELEHVKFTESFKGKIGLAGDAGVLDPPNPAGARAPAAEELEALSRIIKELNEKFGTEFSEEDKVFISQLEERLAANAALEKTIQVNSPETAKLTFKQVVTDQLQDMVDTNFKFYKQVTDNPRFATVFVNWMFERYVRGQQASSRR